MQILRGMKNFYRIKGRMTETTTFYFDFLMAWAEREKRKHQRPQRSCRWTLNQERQIVAASTIWFSQLVVLLGGLLKSWSETNINTKLYNYITNPQFLQDAKWFSAKNTPAIKHPIVKGSVLKGNHETGSERLSQFIFMVFKLAILSGYF